MDPNQWRNLNPTYHHQLDLQSSEQSGLFHGRGQIQDQSELYSLDQTQCGRQSSSIKHNFINDVNIGISEDKDRHWGLPNLSPSSPNLYGSLSGDQGLGTTPVYTGLEQQGLLQDRSAFTNQRPTHSSVSQSFRSQISNNSDLRPIQSYSETPYRFGGQPYTDIIKSQPQYDPISPALSPAIRRPGSVDNFSTTPGFIKQDHFTYPSGNPSLPSNSGPDHIRELSNYRSNQEPDYQATFYRNSQNQGRESSRSEFYPTLSAPHNTSTPVQAVADSTTKPKKPRGRKKKSDQTKNSQENQLVDSFMQQEQQLSIHSQNSGQDSTFRQNIQPSPISSDIYGPNYGNNESMFNMQSAHISSSKHMNVANQPGNTYNSQPTAAGGFNIPRSSTMVDSLNQGSFTNSNVLSGNYTAHNANVSNQKNSFISQGFITNENNLCVPQQERNTGDYPYSRPSNQQSFVDQLNGSNDFDALNSMDLEPGIYSNSGTLFDIDSLNTQQQQNASFNTNSASTVDQAAFSSLISESPPKDSVHHYQAVPCDEDKPYIAEPSVPPTVAVVNPIEDDDDFKHLQKPPEIEKPPVKTHTQVNLQQLEKKPNLQPRVVLEPLPPQKLPDKITPSKSNKNNAFMDSFLSFIQGKKPETLSSVNSSNVKKPELPKYIPEPKRPPRQASVEKSSDSAASTPQPDYDTKPDSPSNDDTTSSRMTMSDEETLVTGTVKNIDTGSDQHPSLKMRIKLQISPPKQKKTKTKSEVKKRRSISYVESEEEGVKSSGEEYQVGSSQEEDEEEMERAPVTPTRRTSTRKAKEKVLQKKFKESDSEAEEGLPETYDSDSDPAWTPFAGEKKEPSFNEGSERRGRSRHTRNRGKPKKVGKPSKHTPSKVRRVDPSPQPESPPRIPSLPSESSEDTEDDSSLDKFMMGSFVINKRDLNNYEGYPIWRIEAGKMMRKFELYVEKGEILHRSLSTYSSWLPNMEKNYVAVRAKFVPAVRTSQNQMVVQVVEEDRPKPKLDSSKETEYEKDPLADMFNVYLQVFLSQAMEPGFLSAIHENGEDFYIKPLNMIDNIISKKLLEMNSKVRWKLEFKRTAELRPHIREVDRPHLKTLCQATENATQNAIKSVHLFGQPYDRLTLDEIPDSSPQQGSMEFLVGKTASKYIGAFHNLHHFKYNLYKRCLAKVDIVREGNTELDNAEILDKCLNNRTWVLKIFDDLKELLEKG